MRTMRRRLGLLALTFGGWLAFAAVGHAQFRTVPSAAFPFNPYWRVAPGVSQAQYLATVRAYAANAASTAPWLYRYNPYPATPYPAMTNPYSSGGVYGGGDYNPYTTGGYTNPYSTGYDSGYNPYYSSGYYNPYGGTLMGAADVMRAYGSALTSSEQARLMREQALQARLDTAKKRFDLERYIKENTPTFPEEQARIAAITLRRIQTNALPGEISSGKSLNILLDDLRKFPGKKVPDAPALDKETLAGLNVGSGAGSLGMLRDGKVPAWPTALNEMMEPTDRAKIDKQIADMYAKAKAKEPIDPAAVSKLKETLSQARERLGEKINDMSTSDYLNAKRFLNDLDLARIAFDNGDARRQVEFLEWVSKGGHTAQDLADYLASKGLKIGPATAMDEATYRAVHAALAALDVSINAHFAAAAPEYKE